MADAAPVAAPVAPTTPAVANGAANAGAAPAEEFLEFLVDGKQERITRSDALKKLSKSAFADKTIQQAKEALKATKAKEAEWAAEQKLLEEDEEAYFRKKGRDPEAFARKILEKKLKDAELNDDQRAALAAKAESETLKKQLAEHAKEKEEAALHQQTEKIQALMISDLSAAAGRAGWEITDANRGEVIDLLREEVKDSFDAGLPVDSEWADRIVEAAKRRHDATFERLEMAVTKGLSGAALAKRLGPRVVDEILKHRLSEIRGKKNFGQPRTPVDTPAPISKANPYMTTREADEQMRKLRGGIK